MAGSDKLSLCKYNKGWGHEGACDGDCNFRIDKLREENFELKEKMKSVKEHVDEALELIRGNTND